MVRIIARWFGYSKDQTDQIEELNAVNRTQGQELNVLEQRIRDQNQELMVRDSRILAQLQQLVMLKETLKLIKQRIEYVQLD